MLEPRHGLSQLTSPSEYQTTRVHVFPSLASLQWFMRRYRNRLIDGQAILKPAGRLLIDQHRFDAEVLNIGLSAAKDPA